MLAPSPDALLAALAARIDALLPQTQCTKCGYAGCRPYAEAIAAGAAAINRCPPGGDTGIARLAALLAQPALPLDLDCGTAGPLRVALIDEQRCIGCTLCIQACPVDAIVGAARRMHTVLPQCCTGCDLCLPPCPVDCIAMVAVDPPRAWTDADAAAARQRHQARTARLAGADRAAAARPADTAATSTEVKQAAVQAALERARARRAAPTPATHAAPLPQAPQR